MDGKEFIHCISNKLTLEGTRSYDSAIINRICTMTKAELKDCIAGKPGSITTCVRGDITAIK